jgi:RHS repeat-associated protein
MIQYQSYCHLDRQDHPDQTRHLFGQDLIYQDDDSETRYLLADGLGSVRSELVGDAIEAVTTYSPYGNLLAQTGASGTVYGFTGEQHDGSIDLLYLRARYFNPSLRVFMSVDQASGWEWQPSSQHVYLYVQNNPVNYVDPSGNVRIKIWTSAFIAPSSITFPHIFPVPPFVDPFAEWHGDNRSFFSGGATMPSARVWHEVILDTGDFDSSCLDYVIPSDYVVVNEADTGETSVTYHVGLFVTIPLVQSAKAPAPEKASVNIINDVGKIAVQMEAHAGNPLSPPGTPPIDYEYLLLFDLDRGSLTFGGEHDWFPWHELYIEVDGVAVSTAQVQYIPDQPLATPPDLFLPPIPVAYQSVPIPDLAN